MKSHIQMRIKPEAHASMLAAVTDDWQTSREISAKCGVAFNRVTHEMITAAKKGLVEMRYEPRGHRKSRVLTYKRKVLTASQESGSLKAQ